MQGCRSLGRGEDTGYRSSCFKLELKAPVSIFLHPFNKSVLKQEYVQNAAKNKEIAVSELLKLQNVLRPQSWLGQG